MLFNIVVALMCGVVVCCPLLLFLVVICCLSLFVDMLSLLFLVDVLCYCRSSLLLFLVVVVVVRYV